MALERIARNIPKLKLLADTERTIQTSAGKKNRFDNKLSRYGKHFVPGLEQKGSRVEHGA